MGKQSAPEPPDYTGVANASKKASKLSYKMANKQLAWAKNQYQKDRKRYGEVISQFMGDMKVTSDNAAEDRDFYETNFQPLEKDLADEARTYDTTERRQKEMGGAQAMVSEQFDQQREQAQQELEAYGIDPSSTRRGALDISVRAAEAAAKAAAGTQASNRVEDVGRALRSEAINVGRGYPGQVAGSYATASQMGGGVGGLVGQRTQIGSQTRGSPTEWMGAGNQAVGQWGNTLNMSYQNQLAQYNANQQASSGWGSALGLIGGMATKAFGFAEGGAVPEYDLQQPKTGGHVDPSLSPSGGAETDDVSARLNAGEFVIPDDVVSWFGEKHMYGLIEKANKERGEAKQATGAIPDHAEAIPGQPAFATA